MSSTSRGAERRTDDFYATPAWCVEALLPKLRPFASVLDPSAGRGAILDAVREWESGAATCGFELDRRRAGECAGAGHYVYCADALAVPWPCTDVIVMNPPFSFLMEFIEEALGQKHNETEVACLLRLGFLAGQKRRDFWRANPADMWVLSRRPSFTGKGTDSADYCWAVWGTGTRGRWGVL